MNCLGQVLSFKYNVLALLIFSLGWSNGLHSNSLDFIKFREKAPAQRLEYLLQFPFEEITDSLKLAKTLTRLHSIALEKKDKRSVFALLYRRFMLRGQIGMSAEVQSATLEQLKQWAQKYHLEVEQVVALHYASFESYTQKQLPLEQMYSIVLKNYDRMKKIGFKEFKEYQIDVLLFHLARFMWSLDDRERAFEYLKHAEPFIVPERANGRYLTGIYNLIQAYHQKKQHYEDAIDYAQKLLNFHKKQSAVDPDIIWYHRFWEGMALLDIANMRLEQGNLIDGEHYATLGYELSLRGDNSGKIDELKAEFDALQVLIQIKLKLHKLVEIAPLIARSRALKNAFDAVPDPISNRNLNYYQNCAQYYETTGASAAALQFYQQADALSDSIQLRNEASKLEQIRQRMDAEKYQAQIDRLASKEQLNRILLWAILLIFVLTLALVWIHLKRTQAKRNFAKAELEVAQFQLAILSKNLHEKSGLVERMRVEVEKIDIVSERHKLLEEINRRSVLTNEDWQHFRNVFEKVYPGFIEAESALYQSITPAEMRLLVFEKLNLSDVEIASLLGISYSSVQQTRWRMRKKKI